MTKRIVAVLAIGMLAVAAQAAVTSTTTHGAQNTDLNSMIAVGDLISGQMGVDLPPIYGWHPANTNPADQGVVLTDDLGPLSGLTGLLNDFPTLGTPAKTLQYSLGSATDIGSIQVLTGNGGKDGRVFSTTVVRYSTDGSTFNLLGYFESDLPGTTNGGRWGSTMVQIFDDASPTLVAGVTDVIFEMYSVDNTQDQYRDPFDGVNPFTGLDDGLTAAFVSPLVYELDVVAVPEPASLGLLVLGGLLAIRRR